MVLILLHCTQYAYNNNNNNNTLFKYIYAHKHDTYLLYHGVIPIKGLLTEL